MIPRYTRPAMGAIWEDRNRYRRWLDVELAVCDVLAERGEIPKEAAAEIRARAAFDPARIDAIEREVRHDVIAFLTDVAERVGPAARYIHLGLTSSDVLDTALALQIQEAGALLRAGIDGLLAALRRQAEAHRHTVAVGRTHGIHAEPTTLGLKFAVWHGALRRDRGRLERALESCAVGKISGAVGTLAHLDPDVEEEALRRLGLRPEPVATQVVQRDRHAELAFALASTATGLDRIATEIRHHQRTEVRELEEPFGRGQKGSSAMPHKRNPIGCEQVSGLARLLRGNLQAALEDVPLWHERDISHSSVERVILPDSTILLDHLLASMARIVEGLQVYPDAMRANLERTRGLVFSGAVLLELARAGLSREEAYARVQRHAMRAWETGEAFEALLRADPEIRTRLGDATLAACFDLDRQLRHVDRLFARAFDDADEGAGETPRREPARAAARRGRERR